jgi:hypothetical protein
MQGKDPITLNLENTVDQIIRIIPFAIELR